MKNKIILSGLLLICILAVLAVPIQGYNPHLEVSVNDIRVQAGKINTINILLYNSGDYDVFETESILVSTVPGITFVSNIQKVFDVIYYRNNVTYDAQLYVDQSVGLGSYTMQLQLSYLRVGKPVVLTVPITMIVDEAFQPMLKMTLNQDSLKFKTNYAGDMSFTIENIGKTTVRDIDMILTTSSSMYTVTGTQVFHINELLVGKIQGLITKIKILETAQLGPYTVSGALYYSDLNNNVYKQTFSNPFEVTSYEIAKTPILVIRNLNSTSSITPGMRFKQVIRVECSDATAYNVKAQLTLDAKGQLTPLGPTTIALGDLQTNGSTTISIDLQLDGSALPGQIPTTLTLRYVDSKGIQGTSSEIITVIVDQLVDFRLLNENPVSLQQGKSSKLEADLLLIGTTRVEFVSLTIEGSGSVQITSGNEYLGAVDPDSPVPFTLSVDVPSSAGLGEYDLKAKITYLDNRNIFQERYVEIPIKIIEPVVQQTTTNNEGIWGWIKALLGWK